jgi:hypothetical protein
MRRVAFANGLLKRVVGDIDRMSVGAHLIDVNGFAAGKLVEQLRISSHEPEWFGDSAAAVRLGDHGFDEDEIRGQPAVPSDTLWRRLQHVPLDERSSDVKLVSAIPRVLEPIRIGDKEEIEVADRVSVPGGERTDYDQRADGRRGFDVVAETL